MISTSRGRWPFSRIISLTLVGAYGLAGLFPLWVMIVFASAPDDSDLSGTGLPQGFLWQNLVTVFEQASFGGYLWNSILITSVACVLDIMISASAGYALARLRYPGRTLFMNVIVVALSLSPVVVAIPVYIAMGELGLLDSYAALILPIAVSALGVFLVRQYALAIPSQLFNAARVDGASELRIFFRVALPLLRPALLTLLLLQYLAHWDSLFWPLIAVSSQELWPLPLGLAAFQGQYGYTYYLLMAASLVSIVPPFVLFVMLQRYYVSGLTVGGVKK